MKKNKQNQPGEMLREKLVVFQREIAELKRLRREEEEDCRDREQDLLAELFEVLDVFDSLENNIRRRQQPLDKTSLGLLKNMRAVQRKLLRLLAARNIVPLDFPDRRAKAEQCRIVETKQMPDKEDEEILVVLKKGYIDRKENLVLRKAEVMTVRNAD
jgi:molecular chaperone GrpE (heat shock protein)